MTDEMIKGMLIERKRAKRKRKNIIKSIVFIVGMVFTMIGLYSWILLMNVMFG